MLLIWHLISESFEMELNICMRNNNRLERKREENRKEIGQRLDRKREEKRKENWAKIREKKRRIKTGQRLEREEEKRKGYMDREEKVRWCSTEDKTFDRLSVSVNNCMTDGYYWAVDACKLYATGKTTPLWEREENVLSLNPWGY